MPSFDLQLSKGSTASKSTLLDGQGYLDTEKGSLTLKIDGIVSEFRPGGVGTDAEKPATLKEGESYFASDTYRLYYGGVKDAPPFVVKGFPFHKMVLHPNGNYVFRICVDPTNGSDENTGLDWDNPKASLTGAYDELPDNMEDYTAFIFLASGTDVGKVSLSKTNGRIEHYWVGTIMNDIAGDVMDFVRCGMTDPFTSNDPYILKSNVADTLYSVSNNCKETIWRAVDLSLSPSASGRGYFGKIIFEDADDATANDHDALLLVGGDFFEGTCIGFKPKGTKMSPFVSEAKSGGVTGVSMDLGSIVGTPEYLSSSSSWRSMFMSWSQSKIGDGFAFGRSSATGSAYVKYNATFAPSGYVDGAISHQIVIDGNVKNLVTAPSGGTAGCFVYLDDGDVVVTGTGTPIIMNTTDFVGYIAYASGDITFNDSSTKARVTKDLTNDVETIYLTNDITQIGDDVVFDLPTSDPGIAGALWSDSGTVKVSAG